MRRPNFFIVGAPRSGTTAMSTFLRDHPNIYIPKRKEPYYFADDLPGLKRLDSLARYMRLFKSTKQCHKVICDASVLYLYSSVAVENIHRFNPSAKILIMLRNPIDMVYSFHSHLLAIFTEEKQDFEKAWRLQPARQQGKSLPKHCRKPALLLYSEIGKLGAQVQRVLDIFPRDQVRVIFFDDFLRSPQLVYEEVLAFLDVPSDGRINFPVINYNIGSYRMNWLTKLVFKPPSSVSRIEELIKRILGIEQIGLVAVIGRCFANRERRQPLSVKFRRELAEEFREDIQKLSGILKRDLNYWC
jgi:hypothetical protein